MKGEQIFGCKHCNKEGWNPKLVDVQTITSIVCEFYLCSICNKLTMVFQSSGQICLPVIDNENGTYSIIQNIREHLRDSVYLL